MKTQLIGRTCIVLAIAILVGIANPVPAEKREAERVPTLEEMLGQIKKEERYGTEPGAVFREPLRSGGMGPEMVVLPSGSFRMGCGDCYDDGKPVRRVGIRYSFAVSVHEVTFEDYDRFRPRRADDEGWGRGRRPVINVSWEDAQAYVSWLSRETGERYRLLSESEWEYAARAGSSTKYSWGNEVGRGRANCDGCGSRWDDSQTAPVESFEPNAFGLYDMHGNVWEWVADCWNESYRGAPSDGSAWMLGECERRVVHGGSWRYAPWSMRSANRLRYSAGGRYSILGFRVARTLSP